MKRVRNIFLCLVLGYASLIMPMKPDEIEELLKDMSQPKIAHSLPDESFSGDDEDITPGHPPSLFR
jgi:hypothetical protein